jgi:hypothetical protein
MPPSRRGRYPQTPQVPLWTGRVLGRVPHRAPPALGALLCARNIGKRRMGVEPVAESGANESADWSLVVTVWVARGRQLETTAGSRRQDSETGRRR